MVWLSNTEMVEGTSCLSVLTFCAVTMMESSSSGLCAAGSAQAPPAKDARNAVARKRMLVLPVKNLAIR